MESHSVHAMRYGTIHVIWLLSCSIFVTIHLNVASHMSWHRLTTIVACSYKIFHDMLHLIQVIDTMMHMDVSNILVYTNRCDVQDIFIIIASYIFIMDTSCKVGPGWACSIHNFGTCSYSSFDILYFSRKYMHEPTYVNIMHALSKIVHPLIKD